MTEGSPVTAREKIKKLKGISAVLGASALAVSACNAESPFMDGVVEDKVFEPERTWVMIMPMYIGKSLILIPYFMRDDEDFIVTLENCDQVKDSQNICRTTDIYVSQSQYDSATIGEYISFNGDENVSYDDPDEKTRK